MSTRVYDVVVVGGGIVGTALAYELARRGTTTALVDRRDAGRATDAGAGILSPATAWQTDDVWYPFAAEAGSHYADLVDHLREDGAPDPEHARCGLFTVSMGEGEEQWFEDLATVATARAPGIVSEVSPDEARRRVPVLGQLRRVLHNPAAERVDGRAMTAAMRHACRHRGVTLLEADVGELMTDGARVLGVRSSEGATAAQAVVIAGGAWSTAFAQQLRVDLPIRPVKGQIVHLAVDNPDLDPPSWPIVQHVLGHYLVSWPDRRVACGGTFEDRGGFDVRPTATGVRELLRECHRLAPGLDEAGLLEVRVGFRPFSADDRPVLGRLPGWENAYVDTGHGADGLLAGPYSGVLVAADLRGERASLSPAARRALTAFDPARFSA